MKNTQTKRLSVLLSFLLLQTAYGESENPWHDHSLRLYMGSVDNAATIDGRGTYLPLEMGSDAEIGLGFTFVLNPNYDLEISLSELTSSASQLNAQGSGNENNSMNISLNNKKLSVTGKRYWQRSERPFVPWAGVGLDGNLLEVTETETVALAPGSVSKPSLTRVSSALGAHISGGIDIYPLKTSAFALSLEGRYNLAIINGPFEGDINSFAFLVGLKWDFWQSTF